MIAPYVPALDFRPAARKLFAATTHGRVILNHTNPFILQELLEPFEVKGGLVVREDDLEK